MNSERNSISNDFNTNQMFKDCKERINSIINNMPLFVKIVIYLTLIFFLINLFTSFISFYLVNIPYFTILHFQIWRLFSTAFITTGFLSIILSFLFWYKDSVKKERESGTVKYMLEFFMMNFFIQILYCLMMLLISLLIQNTMMLKMKITITGIRNEGLWPILMCELTLLCLSEPETNMGFFFFPCTIKAKYYPIVLFVIFTVLSNFNLDFEILCGIAFGFLYHYKLKDKLEISNNFVLKIENSFLCHWMTNINGFVSINNAESTDIPTNLENASNSNQNKNFNAFQGKGVTVGGSDGSISRENVDYAHLSSRNNEENNSDENTLDINNTESV